ncbi:MAG: hypothetical protein GF310_07670, partial [candidate division Zixibacteria bacterium]|nr:hypothetical protein [candidate division Zixibacteria bacterium]
MSRIVDTRTYLDINSLLCFIYNEGRFAHDGAGFLGKLEGLYYPRGTKKTVVYSAGLWMAAQVNGEIRAAVAGYDSEYMPGNMVNGQPVPDNADFKVYKLYRGDSDVTNPDYANWPVDQGAPVNDEGTPRIYGDQSCWSVFNDADPSGHNVDAGSTGPLEVEVRYSAFAYGRSGPLAHIIFMKWQIFNKGSNILEDMYFAPWCDHDIGYSLDDLVGCDSALSLAYAYNDENDDIYGDAPPAVGFLLLQGPLVSGNPDDTAKFMGYDVPGWKNQDLASCIAYYNGIDPHDSLETYNYIKGLKLDGTPNVNPVSGEPTQFMYTGDPVTGSGWNDATPNDKRFMMGTGPVDLMPGDSQEIVIAVIVAQGSDNLSSITELRNCSQTARQIYENDFYIETVPDSMIIYGRGLDGAVDLTWNSAMQRQHLDYMSVYGEFYVFEGYNVYQGETESGPWHLIQVFDMNSMESQAAFENIAGPYVIDCNDDPYNPECDSILRPWNFQLIYNRFFDPIDGDFNWIISQHGTETGIANHVMYTEDHIIGGPLINGQTYYYAITPYMINIEDVRPEDSVWSGVNFLGYRMDDFEGEFEPIAVAPQASPGMAADTAEHTEGDSHGMVIVEYLDSALLVPGLYTVDFNLDTTWNLYRNDMLLLANQTNLDGGYDYPVVEGIMVRAIAPEQGIAPSANDSSGGIIEIANADSMLHPPDNVFWSFNSTDDWYVSSDQDGTSDEARARFNWMGLMETESWEIIFTETGSEYYDWLTDEKWPGRAPFEVWHYPAGAVYPDKREYFFIIDDDDSYGWSWGDRIYIAEDEYPPEPLPHNAGNAGYDWPEDFHLGRIVFNDFSGSGNHPEFGTIVRFNSTLPLTPDDVFVFRIGSVSCGDINADQEVNISDAVGLINYVFLNGPEPHPYEIGDVNCDGEISLV